MVAWMNPPDPFAGISPERIDEVAMFASTGNRLNPIYPPLWISWLRHNDGTYPDTFWKWLNIGEYLSHRMTGEVAIDYSMASQTLVLDQQRLEYRVDLLEEMGLPTDLFPAARNAGEVLGHVARRRGRRARDRRRDARHGGRGGLRDRVVRVGHGRSG